MIITLLLSPDALLGLIAVSDKYISSYQRANRRIQSKKSYRIFLSIIWTDCPPHPLTICAAHFPLTGPCVSLHHLNGAASSFKCCCCVHHVAGHFTLQSDWPCGCCGVCGGACAPSGGLRENNLSKHVPAVMCCRLTRMN